MKSRNHLENFLTKLPDCTAFSFAQEIDGIAGLGQLLSRWGDVTMLRAQGGLGGQFAVCSLHVEATPHGFK